MHLLWQFRSPINSSAEETTTYFEFDKKDCLVIVVLQVKVHLVIKLFN